MVHMWRCQHLFLVVFFLCDKLCLIMQCVLLQPWPHSFRKSFLFTFWQRCCVTALTNCSSHSEEPVCPLSVPWIWGTLSTLRFSLRNVSQLQPKRACPNTGCSGKLIGLFTASHHVNASSEFRCVWWLRSSILLIFTCFFLSLFLFYHRCSLRWLAWCVMVAWSLFNTSLITELCSISFCSFIVAFLIFQQSLKSYFVPLTWQWRKRKRTLELWIIRP